MTWTKREAVSNLAVLGDDEGNVKRAGGLLAAVNQDTAYPSRMNYELVQKNGESIMLAGSASLGRQIGPGDVGKFLKAEFIGWGKAANGKFKEIAVYIWDGEPNDDMKAWPRWKEFQKNVATVKAQQVRDDFDKFAQPPAPLQDPIDDDLPF